MALCLVALLVPTVRVLLVFAIAFLVARLWLQCRSRAASKAPLPPGPWGLPLLGSLPFLGQDLHVTFANLAAQYGPLFQLYLGRRRVVVLSDAKLVREAFRQAVFSGRPDTELTRILQGYGIVNSDGELWREQRAFLHTVLRRLGAKSVFAGKHGLENKIKDQVRGFLDDLSSYEGEPLRMRPLLARAVSNVVGSLVMSMTFKSHEDEEFRRLLELMEEGFRLFTIAMPLNFFSFFRFIPVVNRAYNKIKSNRAETGQFFRRIADEHRATLDPNDIRDVVDAFLVQQNKMDQDGKESFFSEEQLIQIMQDLFSAGLETVTSTLEWAVLFLVANPHVQQRIFEEIQGTVGNREPTLDDMVHMPYTEATIHEVLRRSSVIALGNTHATLEDVELSGYLIPKHTHVLANNYAINMDPTLWTDPEKFDPERFLVNGSVKVPDFFIPFSVGRRMCLGNVLTKMEVFLFLSSLVQKYELIVPPHQEAPTVKGTVAASIVPKPFKVVLSARAAYKAFDKDLPMAEP